MLPPELFDKFMRKMSLRLGLRAHENYKRLGRGMLMVMFNNQDVGEYKDRYIPAAEARERGFSGEILKAIDLYRPACEAVLFVECGAGMKLIKAEFEFASNADRNEFEDQD